MTRVLETLAALSAALGLHISALLFLPDSKGYAQASGETGLELVSVLPADPQMQALIKAWQEPPSAAILAPVAPEMPEIPAIPTQPAPEAAPKVTKTAPILPSQSGAAPAPKLADTVPPLVTPDPKAKKPSVKTAKPEVKAKPKAQASAPAQKAKGTGDGAEGGTSGGASAATVDRSGTAAQKAEWGAAIRARIERRKAYPAAANGAKGKVVLRLRVAADGRLVQVGIAKSSGSTALDNAAVSAVKSAGRFPKAPKGIAGETGFTLPMAFKP